MSETEPPAQPVVFLFGPTGVGKTALLKTISGERFEVVSADSMQVYRGMDIGTAKPDRRLWQQLPHHLIDICDPREQFHLGEFIHRADEAVGDILQRRRIPVLSGGTAYYFKHFLYGMPPAPPSDPEVRRILQQEADENGMEALLSELAAADPVSAERIAPQDTHRILRALEVYRSSGVPLSSYRPPDRLRPGIDPLIIGLTRPRDELYRRINLRVEEMFAAGLRREVEELYRKGYRGSDPGMRAIGYREFFAAWKSGGDDDAVIMQSIQTSSRRYAKRQMTFFRSIEGTVWMNPEPAEAVLEKIYSFVSSRG